ncbi:mitochondrial enolase superfamily member 1 [Grus japonensis]|uniref:Mitochondrial enolase superfamily member 1 n=1 Tax=Grus japonensis TaxID=30415 RepID=A0ABC9X7C3_GRUJA
MEDMRGNKEGFYKYVSSKRKTRENLDSLLNGTGDLVTNNMEETKVLNAFFASVLTGESSLRESQTCETRGEVWSQKDSASVGEDQAGEHLNKSYKAIGPDEMYPQVLTVLANVIVRPL